MIRNWELQLATDLSPGEEPLLAAAQRARDLTRRGRHGSALEALWGLLIPASRKRFGRRRAFLLVHMGHVYRHWLIDVAFRFFREARDIAREEDLVRSEMVAECSIARLYLDWKERERALVHLERGLALAKTCSGRWWQRSVLAEVVDVLESLGHVERAKRRRRMLERLDAELAEELWGRDREPDDRPADAAHPSPPEGAKRCRS